MFNIKELNILIFFFNYNTKEKTDLSINQNNACGREKTYSINSEDSKPLSEIFQSLNPSSFTIKSLRRTLDSIQHSDIYLEHRVHLLGLDSFGRDIDKVKAFLAFYLPSFGDLKELLDTNEAQKLLDRARGFPLPGVAFQDGSHLPKDTDKDTYPPLLTDLTMRERMILGAAVNIVKKNRELEALLTESLQEQNEEIFLKIKSENNSRNLSYDLFGSASPEKNCLIFQSGLGCMSGIWKKLQHHLGNSAYGVSYNRAGLGDSDPCENQASIEVVSKDLQYLLQCLKEESKISSPYILVGHSLGGAFMRFFASQNRDLIKGLVLLDSTTEKHLNNPNIPFHSSIPESSPLPPSELIPGSLSRLLFPRAAHELSVVEEIKAQEKNLQVIGMESLGDLPLAVIASPHSDTPPKEQQEGKSIQMELAALSSRGEFYLCDEKVGHFIQEDDPETVIKAIQKISFI